MNQSANPSHKNDMPISIVHKRIKIILEGNKKVLFTDLSNLKGSEIIDILIDQWKIIIDQGEPTIYRMIDMNNIRLNDEIKQCAKDMIAEYEAFGITVKTVAFNLTDLQKIIAKQVNPNMHFASDCKSALRWLTQEA